MTRWQAILLVLAGAASYGALATFVKIGYAHGFSVGEITGSQMLIGALSLWGVAFYRRSNFRSLSFSTIIKLLLSGALTGLTGVFYYASMQTIPASIAIILLFQFVWIGVVYEWMFERKKPTIRTYLSLILTIIGVILAADVLGGKLNSLSPMGLFLGLCSAFTYAGFIYASGRVSVEISPWLRSPLMITGAAVIIFIIFPPGYLVSISTLGSLSVLAVILALLGAIIPTLCFTFGAPKISSGLATILGSIELPVAVLLAWLVFSEDVSVLQWAGVYLILCAISVDELGAKIALYFNRKRTRLNDDAV
jgi:drug/metabolite transporter (DMT)-like permease